MAVDTAQLLTAVGFLAVIGLATLLSILAYRSLRRMDDVLLKARIYMNRHRLYSGFFALALGMITILALLAVSTVLTALEVDMPGPVGLGGFLLFFVFLLWGLYNFYTLSQMPTAEKEGR